MKRLIVNKMLFLLLLCISVQLWGQAPEGYYDAAKGQKDKALLIALHNIIDGHTNVGYDGLWTVYKKSDVRADGTVWDMYSTSKFIPGQKQCGNYKNVGDCYNREHSFPKSWFSEGSPMKSDAFHIYPTDGKVNGQRSNFAYGETKTGTTLPSHNGVDALGKLGTCSFPGYSGKVFEPVDEYKGDFARTYFYMAARYQDKIKSWGGDMTAGNDYPCYKTWAVNLLLKWHRQDPVSQKEIDRNNAVYEFQHNRNPFIDYPELAEYIWGDQQNTGWTPGGFVKPVITAPLDDSTIDMGVTAIGKPLSKTIEVKGQGISENLSVQLQGTGFTTSTSSLDKEVVIAGTTITITYNSSVTATSEATLKLYNSEVSSTVTLNAKAVDGIPALSAESVDLNSFVARWTNLDGNVNYTLTVWSEDKNSPVYSETVAANNERQEVTGLDEDTQYHYQLSYNSKVSNVVDVKTLAPIPVLSLIVPEELVFNAVPGVASEMKEAEVYTEHIDENVTVTIDAPFEISTDKSNWAQILTVDKDGERFYIRLSKDASPGVHAGLLSLSVSDFDGDEVDVVGTVELPITFLEDFEAATQQNNYSGGVIEGTMCKWELTDAGICGRSSGDRFNGKQSVCFGKTSNSSLEMKEDKVNGASSLSFYVALYGSDTNATICTSYSVDGGNTWTELGSEVISNTILRQLTYNLLVNAPVRIKIEQTEGRRVNIDDIAMSDYIPSNITSNETGGWDAYCRQGKLIIETNKEELVTVYSADAVTMYQDEVVSGTTTVDLPQGMYIVVCGDNAKKVVIK